MPAPPPTMDPGPAREVLAEDVILLRQEVAQAEAARDHAVAERNKLEAYKLGVESMLNEHELLRNNKMLFANFEIQKKQLSECTRKAKQAYALEQQVRELKTELALRPPAPAAGGSEPATELASIHLALLHEKGAVHSFPTVTQKKGKRNQNREEETASGLRMST